jgi:hypothetical protein
MAGWRHAPPQRVRAAQRGAARKSPERLPFFKRPRRAGERLRAADAESERWTPCQADDAKDGEVAAVIEEPLEKGVE